MLEGQIRRLMARMEEFGNERKKEEGWRMARFEWLSGMNKGMWLGGKERNERERRKRSRREKRREWESSDEESEKGKYEALEERIRGLVERIGGSQGGLGKSEEKRRNKGSTSEGDEGNKKWKWDGEHWSEGDDGNKKWRWDG